MIVYDAEYIFYIWHVNTLEIERLLTESVPNACPLIGALSTFQQTNRLIMYPVTNYN